MSRIEEGRCCRTVGSRKEQMEYQWQLGQSCCMMVLDFQS